MIFHDHAWLFHPSMTSGIDFSLITKYILRIPQFWILLHDNCFSIVFGDIPKVMDVPMCLGTQAREEVVSLQILLT
jgi:hypothetical protein